MEIASGIRIWPDKYIEQGTKLSEDIVWGQREKKTLFGAEGIVGTFNVKITPEFASKLGAAIGAFLGRNAKITVSRDTTIGGAPHHARLHRRAPLHGRRRVRHGNRVRAGEPLYAPDS